MLVWQRRIFCLYYTMQIEGKENLSEVNKEIEVL
jgi:hypothetical protein